MSTDVNYSIKGTSDVPQQVDKAKKAMSEMDRQTAAIGKKFTEFGKDLFMGFLAPMVLIREAISFITGSIEKARQDAKDAVDFAAGIKLEELNKSPVDATTRYMAQKLQVDIRTEKEKEQAEVARREVVREFLIRDPRGQEYYRQNAPIDAETGGYGISERTMAGYKSVQEAIFAMVNEEVKKSMQQEKANLGKPGDMSAQNIATLSSNTVGVGMNAQFDILNKQVALQEDMANSLRQIIESDQARIGFQPQKYPDFGGPTQSGRTPLPPR
jgi:hypothetical protein